MTSGNNQTPQRWSECPKCGGAISYDDYEFDDSIWQPQECVVCGFKWRVVYEFVFNESYDGKVLNDDGTEKEKK
jgi:hypothetical protein